jgi:VacB/RNase II family 3'-5' exoribonuclease
MARRKGKKSFNPSKENGGVPKKSSSKTYGRKPSKTKRATLSTLEGMTAEIMRVFNTNPTKIFNYKEVSKEIRVGTNLDRERVQSILGELATKKSISELGRGRYQLNIQTEEIEGVVDAIRRGGCYIVIPEREEDIYVHSKNMNKALHGDTVQIKVVYRKGKPDGIISKIVKRARTKFIGTLQLNDKFGFLIPDNDKITVDIYIPKTKLKGAKNGQKIIGEITDWPNDSKNPFGKITEVLGEADNNDVVMHSILFEYDLPYEFPPEIEAKAEKINFELDKEEITKRRDMRDILTFTIDPHDAKDFDDALSFQVLPNKNYEIGIHIADVSHYVQPGGILDEEAYKRATSVYLVDRVVPMLPEKLSNGVCSLRPKEEKFTFSAIFEMNADGTIKKEWFGRTVIYSDRRFTYEEAQEIIETGEGELCNEIGIMDRIAKKITQKKI